MRIVIIFLALVCIAFTGCTSRDVEISGKVYEDENQNNTIDTGEELDNVIVRSGTQQTITKNGGSFTLEGKIVDNGAKVNLEFSKEGYQTSSVPVDIPSGEENTLSPENEVIVEMQTNNN